MFFGNVLEWFEFCIFAYTEEYISHNFCSGSHVASWAVFTIAFFVRPFGGEVFGKLGDSIGRKQAALYSLGGMLVSTFVQGCLPSKEWGGKIGEAVGLTLLICCRIFVGLCTGGEVSAVNVYICESKYIRNLGYLTGLLSLTSQLAFGIGAGLVCLLEAFLSEDEMQQFGWRIPFWLTSIPGGVSLYLLSYATESHLFLESRATVDVHASDPHFKSRCFHAVGALAASASWWYVGTVYIVTFLKDEGLADADATFCGFLSQLVSAMFSLLFGLLIDVHGVRFYSRTGAVLIGIAGIPLYMWLHASPTFMTAVGAGLLTGVVTGYATSSATLYSAEIFPTRVRQEGVGVSYNLAVLLFGGMGPLLCAVVDTWWFPGTWICVAAMVSSVSMYYYSSLHDSKLLTAAHIRPEFY